MALHFLPPTHRNRSTTRPQPLQYSMRGLAHSFTAGSIGMVSVTYTERTKCQNRNTTSTTEIVSRTAAPKTFNYLHSAFVFLLFSIEKQAEHYEL